MHVLKPGKVTPPSSYLKALDRGAMLRQKRGVRESPLETIPFEIVSSPSQCDALFQAQNGRTTS